jgi:hypothetical protein
MIASAGRGPEITRFAGEEGDDEEREPSPAKRFHGCNILDATHQVIPSFNHNEVRS